MRTNRPLLHGRCEGKKEKREGFNSLRARYTLSVSVPAPCCRTRKEEGEFWPLAAKKKKNLLFLTPKRGEGKKKGRKVLVGVLGFLGGGGGEGVRGLEEEEKISSRGKKKEERKRSA